MNTEKILSVRPIGVAKTKDLTVDTKLHCFYANGIAVSNSHAVSYSAVSAAEFWLKYYYPTEFFTALLNNTKPNKVTRDGRQYTVVYVNSARKKGIKFLQADINVSNSEFTIENKKIRYSLSHIKNVGNSSELIVSGQPYTDMEDFFSREFKTKVNKRVVESLIYAGAFDSFYSDLQDVNAKRNHALADYYALRGGKDEIPEINHEKLWVAKEKEVTNLSLSTIPLVEKYRDLIKAKKWSTISNETHREKCFVFGRVEKITPKTSKSGNPMFIVNLTDDFDSLDFYVFDRSRKQFQKNIKIGYVAAIPMDKFEDSGTRFYTTVKDIEVVEK